MMFTTMCTATMNQNQQKNFSEEQLRFLRLSQEKALWWEAKGGIIRRDFRDDEINAQIKKVVAIRNKYKIIEKIRNKFYIPTFIQNYIEKRLGFYYDKGDKPCPNPRGDRGAWLSHMVDSSVAEYPHLYEEEALKAMILGLEPDKGYIMHRISFL